MPLRQGSLIIPLIFYSADALSILQGGYFVINGSEKVLIAQERMAANRVYVFSKTQPSPVTFLAEIRSAVEKGGKTISSMQIKMMRRTEKQVRLSLYVAYSLLPRVQITNTYYFSRTTQSGQTIKTSLPYIRNDIPIVVVFRALDIIPDKDILDHICYDRGDSEMFEMLKPCLEDAFPIQNRDVSSWRCSARQGGEVGGRKTGC